MFPQNNLPKPTGERPGTDVRGFDLRRAYRAMIREMLYRQWLQPSVPPVKKEDTHG